MNILFYVSNLSYPPIEGAHARTLELIDVLASRGHTITLSGFVKKSSPFDTVLYKKNHSKINISGFREYSGNYISQALKNTLTRIEFPAADIVHFEGFAVISCGGSCKSPKILSLIDPWAIRQARKADAESTSIKKTILRIGSMVSNILEKIYLKKYSHVHVVSPTDAIALRKSHNLSNVVHIPVSFDQQNMAPKKTDYSIKNKLKIVFWGDLHVEYLLESLRWYLLNVHQIITSQIDIDFYILGRVSKAYITEKIPTLIEPSNIHIIEWTQDLNSFLSSMDIAVLPDISGTGLKNRTLHAMALGLPTLGSTFAFEGINIESAASKAICSTSQDYIKSLKELSTSSQQRSDLAYTLKNVISNSYDATAIAMEWEQLYQVTNEGTLRSGDYNAGPK